MAQAKAKKKTPGRQSSKRVLSSSSVRLKSAKMTPAKTKKVHLRLTRKYTLAVTVKLSTKNSPVKKRASKSKRAKTRVSRGVLSALLFISIGFAGVVYSAWQINSQPVLHTATTPVMPLAAPTSIQTFLQASNAVRLDIPVIGVDAPVMIVHKNPDDTLQVPSRLDMIGQYRYAPTPGEMGPAILTGHAGITGNNGVFWRLRELTPGQLIMVTRADGSTATFRVDRVQNFTQDENFPTQEVYGNINHSGLRLITCGGTFNHLTRRYNENTVVFASLVA